MELGPTIWWPRTSQSGVERTRESLREGVEGWWEWGSKFPTHGLVHPASGHLVLQFPLQLHPRLLAAWGSAILPHHARSGFCALLTVNHTLCLSSPNPGEYACLLLPAIQAEVCKGRERGAASTNLLQMGTPKPYCPGDLRAEQQPSKSETQ